jgi:transposase InsO family protein
LSKSQRAVLQELRFIVSQCPHLPWGLHSDNGLESLNDHLKAFCTSADLKFTRSRPYRKNDNAHVEQKNRVLVRELVGYERFDTPKQVQWLNAIYDLHDQYANHFLRCESWWEKER